MKKMLKLNYSNKIFKFDSLTQALTFSLLSFHLILASPTTDIVGGYNARKGQFPATAFILNTGCTATKIGPKLYLSAKHCHIEKMDDLLLLDWSLKVKIPFNQENPESASLTIAEFKIAPLNADIYIIRVKEETSQQIASVRFSPPKIGERVFINGYGCTDYKGMTKYSPSYFPYIQKFSEKRISALSSRTIIVPWIDAGMQNGSGGCNGDSGGPLYVTHENGILQIAGVAHTGSMSTTPISEKTTAYYRFDEEGENLIVAQWLNQILLQND